MTRWRRFLNWIGWRHDTLVCIHIDDCWRWQDHLGEKTIGACAECKDGLYFEKQNWMFRKVCSRCAIPGSSETAAAYRRLIEGEDDAGPERAVEPR